MAVINRSWLLVKLAALVKFIANLLKSIWLFFPSILFIVLTFACFIQLGQGEDIIISFTENTRHGQGAAVLFINLLVKLTFFLAIAFWTYISWYSSRIVAYAKLFRQRSYANQFKPALPEKEFGTVYEVQQLFLDRFPRLVGYACFIIILFAVGNMIFPNGWVKKQPIPCLAVLLFFIGWIDKQLVKFTDNEHSSTRLRNWFTVAGIAFLVLFVVLQLSGALNNPYVLFAMILALMLVFMLYINLRRKWVLEDAGRATISSSGKDSALSRALKKVMTFIHLDHKEIGYFFWFNIICAAGLIAYILAIWLYNVSVAFGPMPMVLLAFGVLLGFGNLITTLSVKAGLNLHFIIFLIAAIFTTRENHNVRTVQLSARHVPATVYNNRQTIQEYFGRWMQQHAKAIDSAAEYPVYFVLGNGGASRSAYWVASVLGSIEDSSIRRGQERFSEHIFCLSGTSGGGVGVAAFYSLLKHASKNDSTVGYANASRQFLQQDFLTYTLARMLGPDYFNYIPVIGWLVPNKDRADALESAFEKASDTSHYKLQFNNTYFDECVTQKNQYNGLPILCVNTTRVQDGSPAVLSSIQFSDSLFNKRVDVTQLLPPNTSIRLSTAAIMGARFPYMSPAGKIEQHFKKRDSSNGKTDSVKAHFFVDGGYFDNSGAGVVQEMIRAILKIADSTKDKLAREQLRKLKIVVLHITNSPQGNARVSPITPFNNDMFSPLLTVLGAYDMQTTVNDVRLANYLSDVNQRTDSLPVSRAIYYPIHLYTDPQERGDKSNGPYAMNWFISDSVRHQMDHRLVTQPKLNRLIANYK
ncbi:MAG TPA: hypothetical protein VL307_15715 [Chitinophagaceae bacterium]|nr:hypothetical protein [Chitinophagaceae bacterium]